MKTIVANWKMNGDHVLAHALAAASAPSKHKIILCPPLTLLSHTKGVTLGAQDCSAEHKGAYTGDVSAAMLKEAGCEWVILGHSERRQHHQETDALIRRKVDIASASHLGIILCVGESMEEHEAGKAEEVVKKQLSFLPCHLPPTMRYFMIAYEPVWAIGTGLTPTNEQIDAMHQFIKAQVADVKVLYGGSVKPENIKEILAIPSVDGALVGGASIEPVSWKKIVQS